MQMIANMFHVGMCENLESDSYLSLNRAISLPTQPVALFCKNTSNNMLDLATAKYSYL